MKYTFVLACVSLLGCAVPQKEWYEPDDQAAIDVTMLDASSVTPPQPAASEAAEVASPQ